jgi:hypothetical protein
MLDRSRISLALTPITAISIIETFGDIKNFQPWVSELMLRFQQLKEFIFAPFGFLGLQFQPVEQSLLLVAFFVWTSRRFLTQKISGPKLFYIESPLERAIAETRMDLEEYNVRLPTWYVALVITVFAPFFFFLVGVYRFPSSQTFNFLEIVSTFVAYGIFFFIIAVSLNNTAVYAILAIKNLRSRPKLLRRYLRTKRVIRKNWPEDDSEGLSRTLGYFDQGVRDIREGAQALRAAISRTVEWLIFLAVAITSLLVSFTLIST